MATDRRTRADTTDRPALLDAVNLRLIEELQADARLSLAELGRRIGLSSPAVADRMARLEQAGVITGYRAEVDPRALGYGLCAVVRVRPLARQHHRIAELARETPQVTECHRITGEDCFLLRMHLRSLAELEEVLDGFILHGHTTTSIVQSSAVAGRPLALRPG